MTVFFIFIFGLLIGSFLNAVVYRLEVGGSIVTERSRCPRCGHILSWYELVPLVSFIIQRRRCRACRQTISWQYPVVELVTGLLFVFIAYHLPLTTYHSPPTTYHLDLWYLFFIVSGLLVIFIFDLKHYIIPNRVLYPLTVAAFSYAVFTDGFSRELGYHALAAFLASGFFLTLYMASKGTWIGFGDVKFAVFMGFFLEPWLTLVALFIAYFVGAIVSSIVLLLKKKGLQSEIPFGPFLVLGTLASFTYGTELIAWYLSINILL